MTPTNHLYCVASGDRVPRLTAAKLPYLPNGKVQRILLALLTTVVASSWSWCAYGADPDGVAMWLRKAQQADNAAQWRAAEQACTAAIKLNSEVADAYYYRGRARYCLGQFSKSVADFDQYVKLTPAVASRQWERGISCYYAGKFDVGAKQFALYQTYHANDVENSVWRYLCMAQTVEKAEAQAAILPIRNDRRPGMMKIYDLYRGKATVADVLEAVKQGEPTAAQLSGRLFYARLYIGLYYEVDGQQDEARKFIELAAKEHAKDAAENRVNHYMYEVAVVHQRQMKQRAKAK